MKACTIAVENVSQGQKIKTIEGLSKQGDHPLQLAWIEAQAPQCGYCQSGQIMQAATLLEANPHPTQQEIMSHMNGNLCRCGTYLRIIKAVKIASGGEMSKEL
jgi:isoquinoline 1-oxidoreductase alpha subunit